MNERDNELDKLLDPIQSVNASEFQVKKWERALMSKSTDLQVPRQRLWSLQLAAAAAIGFVIGALAFGKFNFSNTNSKENFEVDATIVYLSAKAD
jgi:hypothetical protein